MKPVPPSELLKDVCYSERLLPLTSLNDSLATDRLSGALKSAMRGTQVSMLIAVFVPEVPMLPNRTYLIDVNSCPHDRAAYQTIADRLSSTPGTRMGAGEVRKFLGDTIGSPTPDEGAREEMIFTAHTTEAGSLIFLLRARAQSRDWQEKVEERLLIAAPLLVELAGAELTKLRASRRLNLLESALDEMSIAFFMLDARVRPFCLNAAAFSRLAMADAFQLTRFGVLSCTVGRDTLALHEAVRSIINAPGEFHERPLVIGTRDGERVVATLRGVHAKGADADNRAALLLIQHEVHLSRSALDALGLTGSEQRFLSTFLYCSSLSLAAERLNLSEETARTYLKRICAKLGVRKQVELAAFVWNLSLPLRRKSDPADASPPGTLGRLSQSRALVG